MQEPLPIIFDRDLQTATIFSQMPDLQLISQILTPINKQARRIALVEIFSRQTNCARYFQTCYIDYIFHHHDQISRIDFISILKQAGLLKRPLKLTEPMSSLLFGAVFHSQPFAAQQLLAHTLADLQWRNLHGRVTHAKAVKALISVYCLAQADSVRDYLFNTIVHRIRDKDLVSIMHCEMLGYLGPYLIERHIQRACDVLNKIEDLLVDQSFASVEPVIRSGLNIPSFSKHAVLLCNERQVGRVQVAHDLFKKIGEERIFYVPPRLKDRVLSEMNRLTTGSSATLGQSLAFYRNEANSLFDSIFSRTICQNPQIPLGLVNLEEMLIAFPDLDEKYLLPLIMAAREYYNDPDHVLTEQQLAKIYLFFRKDWASDDADETKLIMAKLFALVFHKKLTELTSSELYLCLSEFVHVFCRMPALASIVYEYLNSDDFQCNYSDMLSKLEDRNQERFDRFIYYLFICTQSDIQDLYLNRFYKIIIKLNRISHQMLYQKSLEIIEDEPENVQLIRNLLFILACSVHDLSIPEVKKLFAVLQETYGVKSHQLYLIDEPSYLVPLLHLFTALSDEVVQGLKLPVTEIIDEFLSAIVKNEDEYAVLGRFLIAVQPKLTETQTETILSDYALKLKIFRSRSLFKYPEMLACPSLVAALEQNLQPTHILTLKKIPQQSNQLVHELLVDVKNHVHEKRKMDFSELVLTLRHAIENTNGYMNRMKAGIFCGQPTAPFREMLRLLDRMETGEQGVFASLTELQQLAQRYNARKLLQMIAELHEKIEIIQRPLTPNRRPLS